MAEPTTAAASTPAAAAHPYAGFLKNNLREYGMLISLVVIMTLFQVLTDGTLLQPLNLTNLVLQNSYIVIMALGMLLVIVAGHIDLSVGSVVGLVGALAAVLMVEMGMHFVPATLICLVAGAAMGAAQGVFVAFFKIPSFIVTLAGMLVFKGLSLALLQGQSVGPFPEQFQLLSSGFIPDVFAGESFRTTSLVAGIVVAAVLLITSFRARANQTEHGMEEEPFPFFVGKNILFAAIIIFFCYLLALYRGLPNARSGGKDDSPASGAVSGGCVASATRSAMAARISPSIEARTARSRLSLAATRCGTASNRLRRSVTMPSHSFRTN